MNDNQNITNSMEEENKKIPYRNVVKFCDDTNTNIQTRINNESLHHFKKVRKDLIQAQILKKENSLGHCMGFGIETIAKDNSLNEICRNFKDDCLYGDPDESAIMISFLDKALEYLRNSELYPEYSLLVSLNCYKIMGMDKSFIIDLDAAANLKEDVLRDNILSESPDLSKIANHVFTMLSAVISKDYNTWDLLTVKRLPDWVLNFKRCEPQRTTNFIWEERDDDTLTFDDIGIYSILTIIKNAIDGNYLFEEPIHFDSYSIYDLMIVASYIEAVIALAIRMAQMVDLNETLWKYPDWILDFIYNSYSYVRVDEYILRGGCIDNIIDWICNLPINDTVISSIDPSRRPVMINGIPYPFLCNPYPTPGVPNPNCIVPGAMAYSAATSVPGSFDDSSTSGTLTGDTYNNKKKRTSNSKRYKR